MNVTAFDQRSPHGEASPEVSPCGATKDFEPFWKRESPGLVRFAQSRITSDLDAEDIVSDAMYELFKKWSTLVAERKSPEQLRRYAYGVVKNIIHAHTRRTARCRSTDDQDPVWHKNLVETFVASQVAQVDLCEALAALPAHQFRTLLMYAYGMDSEEIAAAMDARASTVRSRLAVARRLVRRLQQCDLSGSIRTETQTGITKERRSAGALGVLVRGLTGVAVLVGAVVMAPKPVVLFDVQPILDWLPTPWLAQPAGLFETSNRPAAPAPEQTAQPSSLPHPGVHEAEPATNRPEEQALHPPVTQHPPEVTGVVEKVVGGVNCVVDGVIGSVSTQLSTVVEQSSQVLGDGVVQTGGSLTRILDVAHADNRPDRRCP